ncbi:fibronectin type III domain-containing protein [Granulicella sp. S190]|uniref:fibronectin type III domain-containing protein n=1 Tax=Granulicella sp. S190 TaxID=1747226 RepID=UPI00131D1E5A|nr:fibronectin type III domain-containing protein [Granulicella sp. S190]
MKFLLIPCHPQIRRWLILGSAALPVLLAAGCASPGPPRPPSLNLPEPVKDIAAERIGDRVVLHWTTPEKTTDRVAIKGAVTAEICRVAAPPSPQTPSVTPTCAAVKRLPVQAGPGHAEDVLPSSLTVDPPSLLGYRVQLFNGSGRSAGLSNETYVASGAAPPSVEQLRATAIRKGIQLEWQRKDTSFPVQLDRLLVTSDGSPANPQKNKPASPPATKPSPHSRFGKTPPPSPDQLAKPKSNSTISSPPSDVVKLETPTQASDAGGTIDLSTHNGESYRYTARRVRTISLQGHTLLLRSETSPPITVAMLDTFPPGIPTGLEAVPGGATASDRSIDLSWNPDTDPDLEGYSVYRQEISSTGQVAGPAIRLNSTPIVGPAYRDQTAAPGHRYAYRITAVDTSGNESAPGASVQETLREQ